MKSIEDRIRKIIKKLYLPETRENETVDELLDELEEYMNDEEYYIKLEEGEIEDITGEWHNVEPCR